MAGQSSVAATAAVNGGDAGHAGVASAANAAAAGNAGASINDSAIRDSVVRNGSAAAQAGADAAHNTVADVKTSGHVIRQEAESASESVSVNGDVSTDDMVTVETADG